MPTLRFARADELPPEERAALELLARRMGSTPDQLAEIWRAQFHWPALAEANFQQVRYGFRSTQGALSALAKEAMHVAVSMTNRCEY
jgi:alkylhydroperoxidase family enzyme